MAQYVLIENQGSTTYTEEFMGKKISIKPGEKIKMLRREGVKFLGTMSPPGFIDDDGIKRNSRPMEKKLKIVKVTERDEPENKHICNYDGIEFDSEEELNKHLESLSNKTVELDDSGNIVKSKRK